MSTEMSEFVQIKAEDWRGLGTKFSLMGFWAETQAVHFGPDFCLCNNISC